MKSPFWIAAAAALALAEPSAAQFRGPSVQGQAITVAQAQTMRTGQYVVLTGNIVDHLRGDYFTFRDSTGTMRVEIARRVWQDREVTPQMTVRLLGELDSGRSGRYVWVKSLDIVR